MGRERASSKYPRWKKNNFNISVQKPACRKGVWACGITPPSPPTPPFSQLTRGDTSLKDDVNVIQLFSSWVFPQWERAIFVVMLTRGGGCNVAIPMTTKSVFFLCVSN